MPSVILDSGWALGIYVDLNLSEEIKVQKCYEYVIIDVFTEGSKEFSFNTNRVTGKGKILTSASQIANITTIVLVVIITILFK